MEIKKEKRNGITYLKIEGSLNASNASVAKKNIDDIIDAEGVNLIIDLSELQYISSAGLRVFVLVGREIKSRNGKFILCSIAHVKKEFDMSGFTSIFDIQDNIEAALKSFS